MFRLLVLLAFFGVVVSGSLVVGPENAPFADVYMSRRRLQASEESALGASEEYVGELRHDAERRRLDWEDLSLPLPIQIHSLGHDRARARERGSVGREFSRYSMPAEHAEHVSRRARTGRRLDAMPALLTPLYQGYGTHFSYVYIGTPPQRQSVIVDTGSHYTAFPCTGCSQCGSHTDNYWNPGNSSTVDVQKCGHEKCSFGQSYSEGSSWRAYKVVDQLYVGGIGSETVPNAESYKIPFMFGCQTSETGLFRTQLADGIMGMAMSLETLPSQLVEHKVATSNIFAMCFRIGGGIMTLGGVDQRIHTKTGVRYASIRETDGWYTVEVQDVLLMSTQAGRTKTSLGVTPSTYNSGKGVIVDSGTTDTYLTQGASSQFKKVFKDLTGTDFSNANQKLTEAQLDLMPDIVFVFKGIDGGKFEVIMPWSSYIDKVGTDMYAYRIYLTEGSGAVLGANFMNGNNVIFDKANRRVGFAPSDCVFEEYQEQHESTAIPTAPPSDGAAVSQSCGERLSAVSECTARCDDTDVNEGHAYTKTGTQEYQDSCTPAKTYSKDCSIACNGNKVVRGVDTCPEKAWKPCLKACLQSRDMPLTEELNQNVCKYAQQTRSCYSGDCPMQDGDMLVFLDMRVDIQPTLWSYAFSEVFYAAFAEIFRVSEQNIEILNDARSEYYLAAKLHFQVRLRKKDFASEKELVTAAQAIPVMCWSEGFGDLLIRTLEKQSQLMDKLDYARYSYLEGRNIEILNAVALPIGDVRDPINIPVDEEDPDMSPIVKTIKDAFKNREEYFFIGVGLAVTMIMCCIFWLYMRLHRETQALAKEKRERSSLAKVVDRLRKGWQRDASDNIDYDDGHQYKEVQMADLADDGDISNTSTHNPIVSATDADDGV